MSRQTKREYILKQYPSCVDFARSVLGWPVRKSGDRVPSIHPGKDRSPNLAVYETSWRDYKIDPEAGMSLGGSVIDLCAWAMFNGDIGRAMDYLSEGFYESTAPRYAARRKAIRQKVDEWHSKLRPEDIEYLHSRRITDETIRKYKIGFMDSDEWGRPKIRLSIPYYKNGEAAYYISRDRSGFEGAAKYEKCWCGEDGMIENIPWGLDTLRGRKVQKEISFEPGSEEKDEWLVIAEGVFDALSFAQEGWQVLSPMGGYFSRTAMNDVLDAAADAGKVLVIFDNDSAGTGFQKRMAQELFARRINFFIGHVPFEFEGKAIKDVSDYYAAGGELGRLAADAEAEGEGIKYLAASMTDAKECRAFLSRAARTADRADMLELRAGLSDAGMPKDWVAAVIDESVKAPSEKDIVAEVCGSRQMRYQEGDGFYEYRSGVWNKITDNMVKNYAAQALGRWATNARMTGAMLFMKSALSASDPMNPYPVLCLQNGVLVPDNGCSFEPHSSSWLSTIQIPYFYERSAKCPGWLSWWQDVMNGDQAKMMLGQEMAGYVFYPDNRLEKAFFLMGDGGNGKGVFMDTLRWVYGRENCTALPLSRLSSEFDPIMLQYSLANFASENRVDMKGAEARFKQVTSGDDMTAAHKGVDAQKFATRSKLFISCNDFINSSDITHSMLRRMIFLKFENSYERLRKADPRMRDRLKAEVPGILNWCIEGYLRLAEREKAGQYPVFTETRENEEVKQEFLRTINPVASFFDESREQFAGEDYSTFELYGFYKKWCDEAGHKPLGRNAFTQRCRQVVPQVVEGAVMHEKRRAVFFQFPALADEALASDMSDFAGLEGGDE